MSGTAADLRFRFWESIEIPKIDLAQELTSIKLMASIASFTRSVVISMVNKGMSKILVPISLTGRLAAKSLFF